MPFQVICAIIAGMNEKEQKQYEKLILTPIPKLIPALAIPTTISMMITMIYNLVDAYFVGKLGTAASGSIGILLGVQAIFQAIGFMCGHGSGTIISMKLGQGDTKSATRIATIGFYMGTAISLLIAITGLILITPIMRLLGSTETILPFAVHYGFYILLCGPALTLSCILNNIMRYEGRAFYAMIGLVSGGVLNMIGDPILMFGLHLGIDGAGLSTAISQYVSLLILLFMFLSGKTISRIRISSLMDEKVTASYIFGRALHILKNGLPSLVRQILNAVSSMALNIAANPFGDPVIAAMAITGRIVMFIGSVMIGIGQGFQPVAAYNYGAKKYRRIRASYRFTLLSSLVILCLLATVVFFNAPQLVRIFQKSDPKVVAIGKVALRFQCLSIMLQPFSVVTNMLFQSIGKSRIASFTASLRSGLYFLPAIIILPRFLGVTGVESAQAIADSLAVFTCIPLAIRFFARCPKEDRDAPIDTAYRQANDL